ncbi:aldehyde dehydrogenase family protein [Actinopolymorpha alba]|uniref:aldehyde dehydrogenase family protein n=1 Tax=Actinopolymorpha alba TaxID=533267 RepID=UPI00035F0F35|nr:aldehyde dehydrogenase family protein [Actinopolymorpha alba]
MSPKPTVAAALVDDTAAGAAAAGAAAAGAAAAGAAAAGGALWQPPAGGFWEGAWKDGRRTLEVHDPETGRLVGVVMDATVEEVGRAVAHVAREHVRRGWPLWQRREVLERATVRLAAEEDRFTSLIVAEGCKTVTEARREVRRAVETLRLSAAAAATLTGRTVPFDNTDRGEGWVGWHTREPLGVVAAITPFNDPLNLVAHKLGPALVTGNAVVLKPAEATPLSALALVALLLEGGVPGEYLAVVTGRDAGPALVAHPGVDVVSFTGGPATADRIARSGPARKLLMELGGNNAAIVCADADPELVAGAIVDGAFGVAGQNCLSVQRVLVSSAVYERLVDLVVEKAAALVVGSKADPRTDVGPLIDQEAAIRVVRWIEEAVAAGARLHTGGRRSGAYVTPAVLTGVPLHTRLWQEEVFGPVMVLAPFTEVDEALELANGVDTGLQAGVFTRNLDVAMYAAARLRVGAVLVNSTSDFRIDAMPFGGFKRSGIGREGVSSAVEALTEPKVVAIKTVMDLGAPA